MRRVCACKGKVHLQGVGKTLRYTDTRISAGYIHLILYILHVKEIHVVILLSQEYLTFMI